MRWTTSCSRCMETPHLQLRHLRPPKPLIVANKVQRRAMKTRAPSKTLLKRKPKLHKETVSCQRKRITRNRRRHRTMRNRRMSKLNLKLLRFPQVLSLSKVKLLDKLYRMTNLNSLKCRNTKHSQLTILLSKTLCSSLVCFHKRSRQINPCPLQFKIMR